MKYLTRLALIFPFTPLLALAQTTGFSPWGGNLKTWFQNFNTFLADVLVPIVFTLAFLVFIWGVLQYFILGGGDEEKQEKGKSLMLYGIIGFVVMVSIWGIVNLLSNSVFQKGTIDIPPTFEPRR